MTVAVLDPAAPIGSPQIRYLGETILQRALRLSVQVRGYGPDAVKWDLRDVPREALLDLIVALAALTPADETPQVLLADFAGGRLDYLLEDLSATADRAQLADAFDARTEAGA